MGFILGLSGSAMAGKDTVADYLIEKHGWTGKLSFADNLKKMCLNIFNFTEDEVYTQEGKQKIFNAPIVFNRSHLGSIMFWMARTHPNHRIPPEVLETVRSHVGKKFNTPREVLQFVGTEVCRTLIDSYHADVVREAAKEEGYWVITDVRFPNEGDLVLEELKGSVVSIVRAKDNSGALNTSHASETSMNSWGKFTDTIDNSKEGVAFLFEEVDKFLERNKYKCQTATPL
jgi:hypothetical protein